MILSDLCSPLVIVSAILMWFFCTMFHCVRQRWRPSGRLGIVYVCGWDMPHHCHVAPTGELISLAPCSKPGHRRTDTNITINVWLRVINNSKNISDAKLTAQHKNNPCNLQSTFLILWSDVDCIPGEQIFFHFHQWLITACDGKHLFHRKSLLVENSI